MSKRACHSGLIEEFRQVLSEELSKIEKRAEEKRQYLQKTPLVLDGDDENKENSFDNIGSFRVSKLKKILSALKQGETLLFEHKISGQCEVRYDPQHNHLTIKNRDGNYYAFNEDNIYGVMLTWAGDWYVLND